MDLWRRVWRDRLSPPLTSDVLEKLREALATDDPRLIQESVVSPPAMDGLDGVEADGACVIGFCGMIDGFTEVYEVERYYLNACRASGYSTSGDHLALAFVAWWDDTPREIARRELLREVEMVLAARAVMANWTPIEGMAS